MNAEPCLLPVLLGGLFLSSNLTPPVEELHELAEPEPGEEILSGAALRPKGVQARKRTSWQREADLIEIEKLMAQRCRPTEIARRLNALPGRPYKLTASQIRYDVNELIQRAKAELTNGSPVDFLIHELKILDELDRAVVEQYERSKRDFQQGTQTTTEPGNNPTGGANSASITKTITKAQRDGDSGLLALRLKIAQQRCRLLQLYDPIPLEREKEIDPERMRELERVAREELEHFVMKQVKEELRSEYEAKLRQRLREHGIIESGEQV